MKALLSSFTRLLIGVTLVAGLAAGAAAQLTPTYVKTFSNSAPQEASLVVLDSAGNSYTLRVAGPVNQSYSLFQVIKVTPSGTVSQSTPYNIPLASGFRITVGDDGDIYIFINYNGGAYFAKLDSSLNTVWSRVLTGKYQIIRIYATADGKVHVAFNIGQQGSQVTKLALLVLSSTNVNLSEVYNTDVSQADGDYETTSGVQFIATGRTPDQTKAIWRRINESDGSTVPNVGETAPFINDWVNIWPKYVVLTSRYIPNHTTIIHDITTHTGTLPDAAVFTVEDVQGTAGDLVTTGGMYYGRVLSSDDIQVTTYGLLVNADLLQGYQNRTIYYMENFNFNGYVAQFSQPVVPGTVVLSNSNSWFTIVPGAGNQEKLTQYGQGTLTNPIASYTFTGNGIAGGAVNDNELVISAPQQAGSYQVARIIGFTLPITVTQVTAPTTVSSGSNVTVTVRLTRPAPTGGIGVAMTSSSNRLLFPNNSQSATLSIPVGSIAASITMHAVSGTGSSTAAVTATLNGISRDTGITIQ